MRGARFTLHLRTSSNGVQTREKRQTDRQTERAEVPTKKQYLHFYQIFVRNYCVMFSYRSQQQLLHAREAHPDVGVRRSGFLLALDHHAQPEVLHHARSEERVHSGGREAFAVCE